MRKICLLFACMAFSAVVFAQSDDVSKKLSVTTQLFLDELKGEISFERNTQNEKKLGLKPVDLDLRWNRKHRDRMIATPDTIDGEVFISAFIRLEDDNQLSELEALGVQVQCSFDNGLITANIPVDKINEVAGISNVQRVNVASLMTPATYKAREATHVDDLLTLSNDAISSGLTNKYDGTGVVLGVIDTGIDFQHIAFKDKNGNSRIKRAYVYNGTSAKEYSNFTASSPTSDDRTADHGTHTSSTAGGSSVIVNGNTVTVTDDHARATYGGMAPGADLYLAGINGLTSTYLANAFQKICNYADEVGKPVVVSNSWGSQYGPHDGTDDFGAVVSSYFGPSHPNHVCLFAASNDAGKSKDNEGGGYHLSGTASKSNPLGAILRSATYTNTDAGYYYTDIIANAWARSTSVSTIACTIYVLNSKTGKVLTSVTVTPTSYGTSVSGLSNYYEGSLKVYKDYISGSKAQLLVQAEDLTSKSLYETTQNGEKYYKSNYTLAIQFYPTSGSSVIDVWGGDYCYYTDHLSTEGITWTDGTDDMTVSDEAMNPNVISVGAYVTSNRTTNYAATTTDHSYEYTIGDIAPFSSYATASESVTSLQYPWISAPGARLIAGVNHYHTASTDDYSYYGSNFNQDLVVNSASNPYAAMEGTSMATPVAAGIVALWLQAANEVDKQLTNDDVKEIMKETAIHDSYTTTGPNASHFGQGKINALAGVQYILGANANPRIKAATTELTFAGYATLSYEMSCNVKGLHLEDGISVTLNDENGVYSVSPTTISKDEAAEGIDLLIAWSPLEAGSQQATITLSSEGADDVVISLNGTAEAAIPTILASETSLSFSAGINETKTSTFTVSGRFLAGNVTATLTDENGVFSVSPASFEAEENGTTISVRFNASAEGNYSALLTLASEGAESVSIALSAEASDGGTAADPYLNIAKYATIDEAGWNPKYVNNLYKYTADTDHGVAWLTMPVYGAWTTTYYDSHPQKWIASNVSSTQNTYTGKPWTASDIYQGSSAYFTSTTARAMGNGSKYASAPSTITFYVTNITAVKLLGLNGSKTTTSGLFGSSSYPTYLEIYECTRNADGSLTEGTTIVGKETDDTKNASVNLSIASLHASKIYKVVAGQYRGFLYEIAFQTPLPTADPLVDATPTELSLLSRIGSTAEATFQVTATDLKEHVTVTLTDDNGVFSVNKTSISAEEAQGGAEILVSFSPTTGGTYTGTVTLTTRDAAPVTISLTGTVAYEMGDTNMDGAVDISDAVLAVNYVLGSADASAEYGVTTYGDMNADGTLDISDVVAIVSKILGGSDQE